MLDEVGSWLRRRSWSAADWPPARLSAAKRDTGSTVSVVLPALNEESTVGRIVSVIRDELMCGESPVVDELVVLDSGSRDRTSKAAAAAGARVVHRDEVLPRLPPLPGKGEVLWRSLLVTRGDVVCFVDADLTSFSASFVTGIVGPLLTEPELQLVKAMYDRPLGGGAHEPALTARGTGGATPEREGPRQRAPEPEGSGQRTPEADARERGVPERGTREPDAPDPDTGPDAAERSTRPTADAEPATAPAGGGRVTELVARPLLNRHWPRLAGFVQPLGGEYAARRTLLEQLPFPTGYGVELGLLIDALETAGLDALAQVDVGLRHHRHQDTQALGRMAAAIYATAERRIGRPPARTGHAGRAGHPGLTQFDRGPSGDFAPRDWPVNAEERPPIREIPEYSGGTGV